MKKHLLCALCFISLLPVSCAIFPFRDGGQAARLPETYGSLDDPVFSSLPAGARSYLQRLAFAFREQDKKFLLDQGETVFETEVRPHYSEEEYLALLYRADSYAKESPSMKNELPKLIIKNIRDIKYTGYTEHGPLLEIRGHFTMKDDSLLPCLLVLIWQLPEPRIRGYFP